MTDAGARAGIRPDDWLDGAKAAHGSLMADVEGLDDAMAGAASLLPHWTRAHLLTHLARNADSNTQIFVAAARGEVVPQYPGGPDQRTNDIEAGRGRSAAELVADLAAAIDRLERAWDATTDDAWATGRGGSLSRGALALSEWVFSRWRETEVHHSDLALGFTWTSWSPGYVQEDLRRTTMAYQAQQPKGQEQLPAAALALVPNERLAWLLGRHWPDGLHEAPRFI
jgi:maleylpyruvate isomerase